MFEGLELSFSKNDDGDTVAILTVGTIVDTDEAIASLTSLLGKRLIITTE